MRLHSHQKALHDLLKKKRGDFSHMSLRDIGKAIGIEDRAQIIAHHLQQLENKGLIRKINGFQKKFEVVNSPIPEVVYIDLYRATAQCGPKGFLGDDTVIDRIPLSSKTFGITNAEDFFLIKTKGNSMEPLIKEGDLVLARKQEDIENGQTAVVVHDGMPKIKKVIKVQTGNNYRCVLMSLNNEFKNEEITDENSDFRICGLVKGIIKVS